MTGRGVERLVRSRRFQLLLRVRLGVGKFALGWHSLTQAAYTGQSGCPGSVGQEGRTPAASVTRW